MVNSYTICKSTWSFFVLPPKNIGTSITSYYLNIFFYISSIISRVRIIFVLVLIQYTPYNHTNMSFPPWKHYSYVMHKLINNLSTTSCSTQSHKSRTHISIYTSIFLVDCGLSLALLSSTHFSLITSHNKSSKIL